MQLYVNVIAFLYKQEMREDGWKMKDISALSSPLIYFQLIRSRPIKAGLISTTSENLYEKKVIITAANL